MITTKNLQRAGFEPQEWVDLENEEGEYRVWNRKIDEDVRIEVDEHVCGSVVKFHPWLVVEASWLELKNVDSVTQILELIKLIG